MTQCRDINEEISRDHCEWDVTYDMAAIKFSEQIIVKVVRKDQPTTLHPDHLKAVHVCAGFKFTHFQSLGIILHGDVPNLPQTKLGAP